MSESQTRSTPANACDCHIHVFDDRFPAPGSKVPGNFPASEYRKVQQRMGTSRTVIVQARPYVTDNSCVLDAISQLGAKVTRGIGVLHPTVTDAELKRLHDGGIRGIRFTVGNPAVAVTTIDMIEPLAKRINKLGWHVQLHMKGEQIAENADLLQRIESPIVFDHMGALPKSEGARHAGFQVIRRLLDKGRTWVKLSSFGYLQSESDQAAEVARAFINAAPERVVWGTDWPHGGSKEKQDDQVLIGRVAEWAQDEPTRRRIVVDNPQALYGFTQ